MGTHLKTRIFAVLPLLHIEATAAAAAPTSSCQSPPSLSRRKVSCNTPAVRAVFWFM